MCVLCAQLFTDIHWSERQLDPELISQGAGEAMRRRSRLVRTNLVGRVLAHHGLDLSDDWSATNYIVSNRKGVSQVVSNLAELWQASERMTGQSMDPLDDALLARLHERGAG